MKLIRIIKGNIVFIGMNTISIQYISKLKLKKRIIFIRIKLVRIIE